MSNKSIIENLKSLVSEVKYLERMVDSESANLKAELEKKIKKTPDPYKHLEVVADHFNETLGQVFARIKLLEATVADLKYLPSDRIGISGYTPLHNMKLVDEILLSADRLVGNQVNFYDVEKTEAGLFYAWTGPSPINEFELPISRTKDKFAQIRYISVVDEALLKDLVIKVDGKIVPFKIGAIKTQCIIEFKVSATKNAGVTKISLILAKTLSPQETGAGQDARRLGMALSGVSVSNKSIF